MSLFITFFLRFRRLGVRANCEDCFQNITLAHGMQRIILLNHWAESVKTCPLVVWLKDNIMSYWTLYILQKKILCFNALKKASTLCIGLYLIISVYAIFASVKYINWLFITSLQNWPKILAPLVQPNYQQETQSHLACTHFTTLYVSCTYFKSISVKRVITSSLGLVLWYPVENHSLIIYKYSYLYSAHYLTRKPSWTNYTLLL